MGRALFVARVGRACLPAVQGQGATDAVTIGLAENQVRKVFQRAGSVLASGVRLLGLDCECLLLSLVSDT